MTVSVKRRSEKEILAGYEAPVLVEPVTVDRATECHVTPPDVAARMVRYLGPTGDFNTLEPSAGTGNLARALIASGHSPSELVIVERHIALASRLHILGAVNTGCFLEKASEWRGKVAFPRVIMNPPFKAVKSHIAAAVSLLDRCGHVEPATLVALVPITFEHPDAEEMEVLPVGTFSTAKVRTKIIRIRKN